MFYLWFNFFKLKRDKKEVISIKKLYIKELLRELNKFYKKLNKRL